MECRLQYQIHREVCKNKPVRLTKKIDPFLGAYFSSFLVNLTFLKEIKITKYFKGYFMKTSSFQLILAFSFLILYHASFSQNTFEYRLNDSTDNVTMSALETTSGQFILNSIKTDEQGPSKVQLIKLDPSGTLIDTKIFDYQGKRCGFDQVLQLDPNLFLLTGYIDDGGTVKLWFWKMDSLFNEIKSRVIQLGNFNYSNARIKRDSDGNILCFGSVSDSPNLFHAFIYKLSGNGDSLRFKVFTINHAFGQFDLLEKPGNQGYIYVVNGFGQGGGLLDLDTLFEIQNQHPVPSGIYNFTDLRWTSPKTFFLTGEKYNVSTGYNNIGVQILDTEYTVAHVQFLGRNDTTDYFPGLRKNLDFVDLNTIYIGGTSNFVPWPFAEIDCWYYLTRVDTTLNIQWEKFYGGDANYTLYGILATRDEGCLMFGTLYDNNPQILKHDIYVVKVNKDGVLVSIDGNPSQIVNEAILFPNPGREYCIVMLGAQHSSATLRMYNMLGEVVLCREIRQRQTKIDLPDLAKGIYPYSFEHGGRIIGSGKWVSQ